MPRDRQPLPDTAPARTPLVTRPGDPDRRRGIVAAALGISVAVHLLVFVGPLVLVPPPWHDQPAPAIEVELVEAPPAPKEPQPAPEPPQPAEPAKPEPKPIDFSALAPPELKPLPDRATPAQQAAAEPPSQAVAPSAPPNPPETKAAPPAPEPATAKAEPQPPPPQPEDATDLADATPPEARAVSGWSPLPPTTWTAASAAAPLPADRPTQVELLAERRDNAAAEPSATDMGAYLVQLRERVFAQQHGAKRRRLPTNALVRLVIARDGRLLDQSVAASSGDAALDARVLTLVAQAQPFPPLPAIVKGDRLTIDAPMVFLLR
jgi:protein TonB